VEIFLRPMRYKGCHQAHNAKVVICALFTTRNSLKLQGRRKVFSPIRKTYNEALSSLLRCNIAHPRRIFGQHSALTYVPVRRPSSGADGPFDFMFPSVAWATDRQCIAVP